jgi:hypothetical protein
MNDLVYLGHVSEETKGGLDRPVEFEVDPID